MAFKFYAGHEDYIKGRFMRRLPIVGEFIKTEAKNYAPVDTGRLRDSLDWVLVSWDHLQVGTNVEYAWWVEFGTRRNSPWPFLYPALFNNRNRIQEILAQ